MIPSELNKLVSEIQSKGMELDAVEVKTASHPNKTPKLYDSLSALANRPGGGIILLGLDERQGFKVVGVGNPQQVQEDVSSWARDQMEPPVTVSFTIEEVDGLVVMAVEVQEVANDLKPCYYKPKGLKGNGGAYLRSGGTDRPMSDYEIFSYISSRSQPRSDEEIVSDAEIKDLDQALLGQYLKNLRSSRPRAAYLKAPNEEIYQRLHVCRNDQGVLRPTIAGLLTFGKYPQEFFPQLMLTFVQYYGITEDERTPQGARFVDNQSFEGPMAEMVDTALTHIMSAMRKASLIEGMFRRDVFEYPQEALREALANAVAHRDYSQGVRGAKIQVRMFADRLEIRSPGGLFGNVTVDNIDEEHSTRNARLMRMLEDMHVVENRGSGIKAMLLALHEANLEPPRFDDTRASFLVTFRNHTLMNPGAIQWLNQFAGRPINDHQRLSLVYLRQHGRITNSDYRRLNRVDPLTAGNELRGLVESGLIEPQGVGRWTTYKLSIPNQLHEYRAPESHEDRIMAYVTDKGFITNAQCRELLGLEDHQVYYLIKKLCDNRRLKPQGKGRWRKYVAV